MTLAEFIEARIQEAVTLAEFIETRIADDEQAALRRGDPQLLRECEAYRATLAAIADLYERGETRSISGTFLRPLARVWRDHPDYNPAWQ